MIKFNNKNNNTPEPKLKQNTTFEFVNKNLVLRNFEVESHKFLPAKNSVVIISPVFTRLLANVSLPSRNQNKTWKDFRAGAYWVLLGYG